MAGRVSPQPPKGGASMQLAALSLLLKYTQ
jgi:hypothetical protein